MEDQRYPAPGHEQHHIDRFVDHVADGLLVERAANVKVLHQGRDAVKRINGSVGVCRGDAAAVDTLPGDRPRSGHGQAVHAVA